MFSMDAYAGALRPLRRERRLVSWSSAALVLVAAACGNRAPAEAGGEQPSFGTIEPEPFVRLPASVDQEDQQFYQITGVYRLPDGNMVIADASQQLRWFDTAGRLRRSVDVQTGRAQGDRALMWMRGYRGDSLIAYDAASGQLSVFDAQGMLARRFRFATDAPPGLTLPDSPFSDGSLLAVAGPSHVQEWSDGWWAVLQLVIYSPEGDPVERLGTALRHPCENAVEHCAAELSPYSGTWTAGLTGAYMARPDRTEIGLVTGDSVKVLRGPEGWERRAEHGLPTYSRLLLDSEGDLWAQSGDLSRAAVFDRHGELNGTIQVPTELQIYQVGPDFVSGVIEDTGSVERVQVHRLYRNVQEVR
jgi:hypothetical protein